MYATPTYLHYGAYGATVPVDISSLAGKIIGIPGGDTLYILPSPVQYTDPTQQKAYTAPTYSVYVLEAGTNFPYTGMYFHAGGTTYPRVVEVLQPIIASNDYLVLTESEWADMAGSTGAKLPEGTTAGTSLSRGGSLLRPSGAKSVRPKKQAAQPVSRAPAGLPFDPKEPWKSPVFWLLVVSGVLVVGGVGYAALKD